MPQELRDRLNEAEQKELEEAIKNIQQGSQDGQGEPGQQEGEQKGKPKVIDLDSLSEGLKRKIQDYIDSFPEDIRRKLAEEARQALADYEREVNEEIAGKLTDNPQKKAEREVQAGEKKSELIKDETEETLEESEDQRRFRDLIEQALRKDENIYEQYRREVLPLVDALETDLREIFVQRRTQKWQTGFKTGKRIDMGLAQITVY